MRTTVRLDDALLQQAKAAAALRGVTLTRLLEVALREHLMGTRRVATPRTRVSLPTDTGRGLRPGVDLADAAALLDRMEQG